MNLSNQSKIPETSNFLIKSAEENDIDSSLGKINLERKLSTRSSKNDHLMKNFSRRRIQRDSISVDKVEGAATILNIGYAPLAALSIFKRISCESLARIVGVASQSIESFFDGRPTDLAMSAKLIIAEVLGIDLKTGKLNSKHVHVLYLNALPNISSKNVFERHMNALGSLMLESKAVKLGFPTEKKPFKKSPSVHVLQNSNVRIVFFGARKMFYNAVFDVDLIHNCKWALKDNKVLDVYHADSAQRLLKGDVTTVDFDEIFEGKKALCWDDVEHAARKNLVGKREIIQWIEAVSVNRVIGKDSIKLRVIDGGMMDAETTPTATSETEMASDVDGARNVQYQKNMGSC